MKNADLIFSIYYYKFLLPNQKFKKNLSYILVIYKYYILEEQ